MPDLAMSIFEDQNPLPTAEVVGSNGDRLDLWVAWTPLGESMGDFLNACWLNTFFLFFFFFFSLGQLCSCGAAIYQCLLMKPLQTN